MHAAHAYIHIYTCKYLHIRTLKEPRKIKTKTQCIWLCAHAHKKNSTKWVLCSMPWIYSRINAYVNLGCLVKTQLPRIAAHKGAFRAMVSASWPLDFRNSWRRTRVLDDMLDSVPANAGRRFTVILFRHAGRRLSPSCETCTLKLSEY